MDKKIVFGLGILSILFGILSILSAIGSIWERGNAIITDLALLGYYLGIAAIALGGLTFVISEEKKARRIGIMGMFFGIMGIAQLITVIIFKMFSEIKLCLRDILNALVK